MSLGLYETKKPEYYTKNLSLDCLALPLFIPRIQLNELSLPWYEQHHTPAYSSPSFTPPTTGSQAYCMPIIMSIIMNSDTEICSIARTITSSSETACVCYVAFVRILQGLTLVIVHRTELLTRARLSSKTVRP